MKISQALWSDKTGWIRNDSDLEGQSAQLLFIFGSTSLLKDKSIIDGIRRYYPDATLFGCSTSGEIFGTQVLDGTITVTAVRFEHARIKKVWGEIERIEDSHKVGENWRKNWREIHWSMCLYFPMV